MNEWKNEFSPNKFNGARAETLWDQLATHLSLRGTDQNRTHLWQGEICTFIFNSIRHINTLHSENLPHHPSSSWWLIPYKPVLLLLLNSLRVHESSVNTKLFHFQCYGKCFREQGLVLKITRFLAHLWLHRFLFLLAMHEGSGSLHLHTYLSLSVYIF